MRGIVVIAVTIVVAGALIGYIARPKAVPGPEATAPVATVAAGDWVPAETVVPEGFGLDCPLASPGECVVYDRHPSGSAGAVNEADEAAEDAGGPSETPAGRPMFDVVTALSLSQMNLEGLLRDPGSARYRGVWRVNVETDGGWMPAYCGRVSGRNGFGGFATYTRFVATPVLAMMDGNDGFEGFYRDVCVDLPRVEFVNF